MKLPFRKRAYIPEGKLTDYLLSETHPVGGSKAKFFHKLGFDETNADQLARALLHIARSNEVKELKQFIFGTNYVIEGTIRTPKGKNIILKTVWFIKREKRKPSFVTAYPV